MEVFEEVLISAERKRHVGDYCWVYLNDFTFTERERERRIF